MHLDVGCLEARSLEASGTLGRREYGASSGLYRTGNTRVGRRPVSSQSLLLVKPKNGLEHVPPAPLLLDG
eukprot:4074106-Prymnesium_polylepis.1